MRSLPWLAAIIFFSLPAQATIPRLLVVLDPGHGGEDAGAVHRVGNRQVSEKALTLSIARETAKVLRARGIPVILTRYDDSSVPLDKRAEIANQAARRARDTVFISIHANSSRENQSSGIETYVFNAATNQASERLAEIENGRAKAHSTLDLILTDLTATGNFAASRKLAERVQESVVGGLRSKKIQARDRGVRQALFYVLMQTRMPGILFEPGFISNSSDLGKLSDTRYQHLLAEQLAHGVLSYTKQ